MPGRFSDLLSGRAAKRGSAGRRVIVIGAGPNGLAAAHRLAERGCSVTLLERAPGPGGGARALEGWEPGLAPSLAHLVWALDPRVEKAMDLPRHGLSWLAKNMPTSVIGSRTGAEAGEARVIRIAGGITDSPDAEAWARLHRRLTGFATKLEPFRRMAPPRLALRGNSWPQLIAGLTGLRRLGREEFRSLLQLLLINVFDLAQDELADRQLRAALCFDAVLGAFAGPRSPNTLILALDRLAGQIGGGPAGPSLPKGGLPALSRAMTESCRAAGVTLRSNARVEKILVRDDQVCGVRLESGEVLEAGYVLSALCPGQTLLDLVGPAHFDSAMITGLRHRKARGATAKLHLALSALPDFPGADPLTRILLAGDENEIERAFNPVKYGETPARPVMEILLPTAFERKEGPQLLSANLQFAPFKPKEGPEAAKAAMLAAALARLEEAAPGIGALITRAEILMPWEIERDFGMAGGSWHHGDLSVEQMLMNRPLYGLAQYATPLPGLFLGSAGSHPGGMSGAAGWNAAEALLSAPAPAKREDTL